MSIKIPETDKDKVTLMIGEREIVFSSAKFVRTMDTLCDALTITMPWTPGLDTELDKVTAPYSYSDCAFYIGGDLQMLGILYDVTHKQLREGSFKELSIYTRTADLIDSTVWPPYEANNISLVNRCKQQANPFGINVVVGDGVNETVKRKVTKEWKEKGFDGPVRPRYLFKTFDEQINYLAMQIGTVAYKKSKIITEEYKFPRVAAHQTDKIFDHLKKLAAQRACLLSCTKYGDLLITKANLADPPVGTIEEGKGLAEQFEAKFVGRKRFNIYRALMHSARHGAPVLAAVVKDNDVPAKRILTFQANNVLPGEGKKAAEWQMRKHAAESFTFPLPVNGFYNPQNKIWQPNTLITIKSKILDVPNGEYTLLIKAVEFNYENNGIATILSLTPPWAYSLDLEE